MFSGKHGQLKSITGFFTSCTSNRMMTSHDGSLLQIMESCLVCRAVNACGIKIWAGPVRVGVPDVTSCDKMHLIGLCDFQKYRVQCQKT